MSTRPVASREESRSWNVKAIFVVLASSVFSISWNGDYAALAQSGDNPIAIVTPWTRATPNGARTGVAYMTIRNSGLAGDRLVAVSSAIAESVEAHETIMRGTTMQMRPAGSIPLPAGGEVQFKPGGLHFMLIDLKEAIKPGQSIAMTLTFERAGPLTVILPAARLGSTEPPK